MASKSNTPKQSSLKAGQKFSNLTAIEFVRINNDRRPVWKWLCDCGKTHEISARHVLRGTTKSCGCLSRKGNHYTHGMRKAPEYRVWAGMIQRCTNPNHDAFHNYGERGIKICDRWKKSFASFYEDMGQRPSPKHTIERIQNDESYCKENCKWATRQEQARNTRQNIYVWYKWKKTAVSDLAASHGIPYERLRCRLKKGWDIYTALTRKSRNQAPPRAPGTDPAS